jgi:hypothetical protein
LHHFFTGHDNKTERHSYEHYTHDRPLGGVACLGTSVVAPWHSESGPAIINYMGPERVRALRDGGEKIIVAIICFAKDFPEQRIAGAHSLPLPQLEKRLGEIPRAGCMIDTAT